VQTRTDNCRFVEAGQKQEKGSRKCSLYLFECLAPQRKSLIANAFVAISFENRFRCAQTINVAESGS
jgi:hypothetical protein